MVNVHKSGSLPKETIDEIEKLYKVEMSKLPFDISEIQKKCMVGIDNINLEINKL
jgi:hypothetical protein